MDEIMEKIEAELAISNVEAKKAATGNKAAGVRARTSWIEKKLQFMLLNQSINNQGE